MYVTLGLAGFIGLLVPLAFIPFTKILVTKYFRLQKEILQAKDKRVSTMNEVGWPPLLLLQDFSDYRCIDPGINPLHQVHGSRTSM